MWMRKIARHLVGIAATVLLGGLLAATMVRLAPGFDVDQQQLDARLSSESIAALRAARAANSNIVQFYLAYLSRAVRGDLGESQNLHRPVRSLIAERLPVTLRMAGLGLLLAWVLGASLAFVTALVRAGILDLVATVLAGTLLCIPSAVLGLLVVVANAPGALAIALVIFPNVYRYCRNLLAAGYAMPHIITASAKGLGRVRVLMWHVVPITLGQMVALGGVSVSMAFGASIPVEALCGIPGVGQLAWEAALARDLPLLVTLTVMVTVITMAANSGSELIAAALRPNEA
jgi:peptide/nickel transport system permease protein